MALLMVVTLGASVQASSLESLETVLTNKLRLSSQQVEEVLMQQIPEHAQREIDYGFVDEEFVRFMMGVLTVREKMRILDKERLKRLSPLIQVDDRYSCASVGLNLEGGFANDCLFLWTEFIANGPELPYGVDPSVSIKAEHDAASSEASLEFDRKQVKDFIDTYKIPTYMHDDLLSLRVSPDDLVDVFRETAEHPREEFKVELAKVERQPAVARGFGRLICAPRFNDVWRLSTPWGRTCYAYWHRYMDMKGDGDQISEAYRNNTEPDPRQRDFRPPPPTRAEAELGEFRMHALMWKLMDREMCESKSAACSNTLKEVMEECRKKHEALRQAFLDDPNGDNSLERFTDSVHECALADKRLAPYLPAES